MMSSQIPTLARGGEGSGFQLISALMKRLMAFLIQQIIKKKNTILFILWILPVFNPGQNFAGGAFEHCPISNKICKIAPSHPHLLIVDDDSKIIQVKSLYG